MVVNILVIMLYLEFGLVLMCSFGWFVGFFWIFCFMCCCSLCMGIGLLFYVIWLLVFIFSLIGGGGLISCGGGLSICCGRFMVIG